MEAHVGLSELRFPGDNYLVWLARLHAELKPETYLEIGVARGQSLACARPPTRSIGVDPAPMINAALTTESHIFCEESDLFFARRGLDPVLSGRPLALSFIDGLHVFSQSLKDFLNTERYCDAHSVVLLHDTAPLDEPTQRPDRQRRFYSGDVWKTVVCLKHFRPDLDIFTIATAWTGLTVVTGFNPETRGLPLTLEEATAHFENMPFSSLEGQEQTMLNIVPNNPELVLGRLMARGIIPK
ncbi:class I SAM-dependent methyltransferase [Methylocystis sp. JAN1]|uniref:class I SAM-dependent methyltransferase n=1 Tax=Methylocystis sp. JAN1 TaxID=3397211 RepID=UPI003FA2CDAD